MAREAFDSSEAQAHGLIAGMDGDDGVAGESDNTVVLKEGEDDLGALLFGGEEDGGLLDEGGADDSEQGEEEQGKEEEVVALTEIFKAGTAGQALRGLTSALERLMSVTNALKGLGEKPIPPGLLGVIRAIMGALNLIAGGGAKGKTEKVQQATMQAATSALQRLMALVRKVKAMDANEPFPADAAAEAKAIAGLLSGLLGRYPSPRAMAAKREQGVDDERPGTGGSADDPIIIFKAGAKMRQARLSKLRQAVEILNKLMEELDSQPEKATKNEEPQAMTKQEVQQIVEQAVADFVTKLDEATAGIAEKIDAVGKRVDGLENVQPAGEGGDDPPVEEVTKKKPGLWSNIIPVMRG